MESKAKIIIGSRGSKLALAQSNGILAELAQSFSDIKFELKIIKTKGDKIQDAALAKIGGKGFFTKELEEALLARQIDLAVHSLKDLPVEQPRGLMIGAITRRLDARDIIIKNKVKLRPGDKIGTSSLRRQAQLRSWGEAFEVVDLRGNLDTRLRKLKEGQFQAVVVALAGVKRLKVEAGYEVLSVDKMLPAPGQGALAVQIRVADDFVAKVVSRLNDQTSAIEVAAERAFLLYSGGGCQAPIGAYATVQNNILELTGKVISLDGQQQVGGKIKQEIGKQSAEAVGQALAKDLLARGAGEMLCAIKK